MVEYKVATMAVFGASAIAGNKASPSLLIAFPICADKGIMPPIYMLVIITCGPQPGRSPITTAIKGRYKAKPPNKLSRSILKLNIQISKIRNANTTQAVTKFVSAIVSLK